MVSYITLKSSLGWSSLEVGLCIKPGTRLSTHRSAPHHNTPNCLSLASVDSKNDLRHTLWTCSCAVQTRSDCCQSIKVSIILCMISVDSFFTISVAWQQTSVFYVTLNKILLGFAHIGSTTFLPHAHTFAVTSRLALHWIAPIGAVQICALKYVPSFICKTIYLSSIVVIQ